MGIPSFYRWLIENYPKVLNNGQERENNTKYKSLYIDMNGVIHSAVKLDNHGNPRSGILIKERDLPADKIKSSLFYRLDQIVHTIKPNHILYLAIDGVPPRAKSIEQRKRRFKSSKETLDTIHKYKQKAISNKNGTVQLTNNNNNNNDEEISYFDSNSISPATEFITEINKWVREYLLKISNEYQNLNIIVSDSTIQGEGEHKIMDFIRSYQKSNLYQKDETHIFYGMDADLIFLGLSTHEKSFFVLRDALDLIQCSLCKGNDGHLAYECPSAYARRKLSYPKTNRVNLRNVPICTTEKTLADLFSSYGEIVSVHLERANTKRPSLSGFVDFKDPNIVNEIAARGGSWFINDDRLSMNTIITNNSNGESVENVENDENSENTENTENSENDPNNNNTPEIIDEEVLNNTVFVSNIDSSISKFDIEAYFSQYGNIEKVEILPSPRYPKQKFAMVAYADQESARNAYKLSRNTHFFGNEVTVKKSIAKKVPETPEQKAEREKITLAEKEKRQLEREFKLTSFQAMAEKNTSKDTCYFYLGICEWDLERAYKLYLEFDKAPLEAPNRTIQFDFDFVNLSNFRLYFKHYLTKGLTNEQIDLIDDNRCINDFTLMSMLLGNDFLPHLPALHISSGSIELILSWYREFLTNSIKSSNQVKYITTQDSNNLIYENFLLLLKVLSDWESHIYPESLEKQVKKEYRYQQSLLNNQTTQNSSNTNQDSKVHTLKDLNNNNSNSPKKTKEQIDSEFVFNYEKDSYYKIKFDSQYPIEKEQLVKNMCKSFVEGLVWVLRYYSHGCKSWEWFYPFHYAPLARDLVDWVKTELETKTNSDFEFQLGEVLQPIVHLTSVLPVYSSKFLPQAFRDIMVHPSPVSNYYREDFKIDQNGEDVPWKGVVLLDFIDFNLFKQIANPLISKLTPEEAIRNHVGTNQLIVNNQIYDFSDFIEGNNNATLVQSNSFEVLNNSIKQLNQRDLNWSTRKIFTMYPTPNEQTYNSLPKTIAKIAPSHQDATVVLSQQQSKFLEWRKLNGFNQSLEILESIDPKQCNILNIDKKNSVPSFLRLFSNEISKNNKIFITSQDDDPQIIINIGFNKPTKINGIKFLSSFGELSPKLVKIYINSSIDFNSTTNEKYKIEFTHHDQLSLENPTIFNFTDLKFKQIQSLSIFVEDNFNSKGSTKLEKIILL